MNQKRDVRKINLLMELKQIEAEEEKEKLLAAEARAKFLFANIDSLLAIQSEHCRTSCSDADPCNFGGDEAPRCLRCYLLKQKHRNGYWDGEFDLELQARLA